MIECVEEGAEFSRDARDLYTHAKIDHVKEADLDASRQPAGTHISSWEREETGNAFCSSTGGAPARGMRLQRDAGDELGARKEESKRQQG